MYKKFGSKFYFSFDFWLIVLNSWSERNNITKTELCLWRRYRWFKNELNKAFSKLLNQENLVFQKKLFPVDSVILSVFTLRSKLNFIIVFFLLFHFLSKKLKKQSRFLKPRKWMLQGIAFSFLSVSLSEINWLGWVTFLVDLESINYLIAYKRKLKV